MLYAAYAVQLSQSRFNSEKISQTAVKGHVEVDKLSDMKKQKLQLKDEISRLNKLQWEHDHEHVDLGE